MQIRPVDDYVQALPLPTDVDSQNDHANDLERLIQIPQSLDLPVDDVFSGPRFPRWIPHKQVDSTAMLQAFEEYVKDRPQNEHTYFSNLYNLEHAGRGDPIVVGGIELKVTTLPTSRSSISKPCERDGCRRCIYRMRGFVFHWYHPAWSKHYIENAKKENCWKPGQKEAEEDLSVRCRQYWGVD